MNKKLVIGVGVAATLVAAYFVWKRTTQKPQQSFSDTNPDVPIVTCKFPMFKCPNNPNKCYNPLVFGENQCGNVL